MTGQTPTRWTAGHLRVALIDDHAVVRAGYRRFLELEGIAVALEFGHADEAYAALVAHVEPPVDVLVVDLHLPGRGGLELTRRLVQRWPQVRILVFSMHADVATVHQALRAGAMGYVSKSSAPEVLVSAVQQLALGRPAFSPDVQAHAEAAGGCAPVPAHSLLSAREFAVLQSLLEGQTVEAIAQALALSTKTVANYQTAIRQKLGASNAVELLRYAQAHGLKP